MIGDPDRGVRNPYAYEGRLVATELDDLRITIETVRRERNEAYRKLGEINRILNPDDYL